MSSKLLLFGSYTMFIRTDYVLSAALETMSLVRKTCGYTFELPMPVAVEIQTAEKEIESKHWFTRNPVKQFKQVHNYLLVFDRELTEHEWNMWRMYKVGWHAKSYGDA